MSIVPASGLSRSDLSHLGNNVRQHGNRPASGGADRRRRRRRRVTNAVNRSLAVVGERVARLYLRPIVGL